MQVEPADKIGELWDIYDINGNPTGRTITRGEPLAVGDYHQIAEAIIFDANGLVLVQHRSFKKLRRPGEWTSETGGSVLAGETSLAAMHREIHEELGLVTTFDETAIFAKYAEQTATDTRIATWYVVQTTATINDLALQASEVIAAEFVSVTDPRVDSRRSLVDLAVAHLQGK